MKHEFVETSNAKKFAAAVAALTRRGAPEACLLLVDGVPGLGKSWVTRHWAMETGSPYVRCKAGQRPTWLLREIIEQAGGDAGANSYERLYRAALIALGDRKDEADRRDQPFGLVIDEVDHIADNVKALESIRDLTDALELPTILVGMDRVRRRLSRHPQISSRISQPVEFTKAVAADVGLMAARLIPGVTVAQDLIDFLADQTKGCLREVMEGLAAIERFATRNHGVEMTRARMVGQPLLVDRRTGAPVLVTP